MSQEKAIDKLNWRTDKHNWHVTRTERLSGALFDSDRLGQVARLINVGAFHERCVIRQQLHGNRMYDR